MICPYCDIEIDESAVEIEDGYCPECGVFLSAGNEYSDDDDDFDGGGRSDYYDDAETDEDRDLADDGYYDDDFDDIEYDDIDFEDDDGGR